MTVVINLHGALIFSAVHLPEDTTLNIKNKLTGLEVLGRVVWSGNTEPSGYHKLGMEFEDASPAFWADAYE